MATLKLKDINKVYPNGVQAVFDFNLDIKDREFVVLVGPSGCGKSTTLRMIAGLEEISSGELHIDDLIVNDVAPKDRNIAMVFQSYALYPHMTVYDNMAFGLKIRKMPKNEIDVKVKEAAGILGLLPYLDRKPKALSGGQRQRVALGRAIVRNAKVFLMDEPLSNLDAKLRVQMRGELIKLHNRLDTTTIYVTHDQIEAMTMATRIVVQKDGYIQQVGAPKDIYDNPANIFVGGFIGTPPMNFIEGEVDHKGYFISGDYKIKVPEDKLAIIRQNRFFNKPIALGIRPEDIHDNPVVFKTYPESTVKLIVDVAELLGAETNIYTDINGFQVCASVDARADIRMGDEITLALDMNKCHFFDLESENRLVYDYNLPPDGIVVPGQEKALEVETADNKKVEEVKEKKVKKAPKKRPAKKVEKEAEEELDEETMQGVEISEEDDDFAKDDANAADFVYHISQVKEEKSAHHGKWRVRRSGSSKTIKHFDTQKEAIENAKRYADSNETRIVIHKRDGRIRKQSY